MNKIIFPCQKMHVCSSLHASAPENKKNAATSGPAETAPLRQLRSSAVERHKHSTFYDRLGTTSLGRKAIQNWKCIYSGLTSLLTMAEMRLMNVLTSNYRQSLYSTVAIKGRR